MAIAILPLLRTIIRRGRPEPPRRGLRRDLDRGLGVGISAARRLEQIQSLTTYNILNRLMRPLTRQLETGWFNRTTRIRQDPPDIGPIHIPSANGARSVLLDSPFLINVSFNGGFRVNIGITRHLWLQSTRYHLRDTLVPAAHAARVKFYRRYFRQLALFDPQLAFISAYMLHGMSFRLVASYLTVTTIRDVLGGILQGAADEIRKSNREGIRRN